MRRSATSRGLTSRSPRAASAACGLRLLDRPGLATLVKGWEARVESQSSAVLSSANMGIGFSAT